MATRQYIGARYVPLFYNGTGGSAAWTANTQYEALTIVTRNGNSYTSRKQVPANIGAPESNPEYWVSTGLYNEQVEQYRQEVAGIAEDVQNLESSVNDSISQMESDIAEIEETVTPKPNVIMIGDSYGHASGSGNGWIDKLKNMLSISTGNLFESAIGGAGFNINLSPNDFNTMFNTLKNSMTAEQIADVGLVIIAGGSNDMGIEESTLTANVKTCINNISTSCPNAKIYIGEISGSIANNFATAQLPRIITAYKSAVSIDRVYYLNNVEYCLHLRDNLNADLIHPNATGYTELANAIFAALKDSYNYRKTVFANTFTFVSGGSGGDCSYLLDIDNNYAQITFCIPIDVTLATAVTFEYNQSTKLGSFANKAVIGAASDYYNFNRTFFQTQATVRFTSNQSLHTIMCECWIDENGDLYIRNRDAMASGSSAGFSSIDRFILPRLQISAPSVGC